MPRLFELIGNAKRDHRRHYGKTTLVLVTVVVGLSGFFIQASAAKTQSPLAKGMAFYKGKTITFTEPNSVGGSADIIALDLAPYLSSYLHATVNVEAVPAANGILEQDQLATANPDGLTMGLLNLGTDLQLTLTGSPGLNFNPSRIAWLGVPNGVGATPVVTLSSSPYHSFADLVHATSPVPTLVVTAGTAAIQIRTLFGVLGIPTKWISGFPAVAQEAAALQAGEGQVAQIELGHSGTFIAGGQWRVLAASQPPPVGLQYGQYLKGVPTYAQIFAKYPPKTARGKKAALALESYIKLVNPIAMPAKVQSYKQLAMVAAIKWAATQSALQSQLDSAGVQPGYISPTSAKATYATIAKDSSSFTCYINGTCTG